MNRRSLLALLFSAPFAPAVAKAAPARLMRGMTMTAGFARGGPIPSSTYLRTVGDAMPELEMPFSRPPRPIKLDLAELDRAVEGAKALEARIASLPRRAVGWGNP